MTTDAPDWEALGGLLVTRRVQLDPHYKNRRKFVADTCGSASQASWYRIITDIEKGNRDNYSRETLATMEIAYQLEPGSLIRSVRTGVLEPRKQAVMITSGGPAPLEAPVSEVERRVLENIRAEAVSTDRSIGDVLVERGLASPDELTLSEDKRGDRLVKEILESDLSEEVKNILLMDYVGRRRHHYRKHGLLGESEQK